MVDLALKGSGSLFIKGSSTKGNYGIHALSLSVEDNVELYIKTNNGSNTKSIRVSNNFTIKGNAKVEMESQGEVIAAFGSGGNIFIEDNAKFKGTAHGMGAILNTNRNINIEEGTTVELIRHRSPNSLGNPKFFDYGTSTGEGELTLADGLKLQGSEDADGSSPVDAKLSGTDPNKTVVRDSDGDDVFLYVLIKAE